MHVPNFGLGAVYALGAFISFYWISYFGVPSYIISLVPVIFISGIIAILHYILVFKPLATAPHAAGFVGALGIYYAMEGLWSILFGPDWRTIATPYDNLINIGPLFFTMQQFLVVLVCSCIAVGVYLFMMKSFMGKKIRASAEDADSAALLGISMKKVSYIVFGLGGAVAGVAGTMISPLSMVGPSMGIYPITKAFIVVVLGGMGSIQGAILGGFILGVLETLGSGYISSMYQHAFPFIIFLFVLIVRPQGLFKS
jgi:branched-chain amino acid transport system permease protein